jgi:hypothetical protein
MKQKKHVEGRVRGWLPKETKLPSQNSPIQRVGENRAVSFRRVDTLGIVLISLSLFLFFILPLPFYINEFQLQSPAKPVWADVSQGLGILTTILFSLYQYRRQTRMKNKQN